MVRALASHQRGLDPAPYVSRVSCWFSPCSERFFSRYSGSPSPQKPTFSKFQFDPEFGGHMFVNRKTVRCYPKDDFFIYLMFVAYTGLHKNCCSVVKEKQKLKHSQKDVL